MEDITLGLIEDNDSIVLYMNHKDYTDFKIKNGKYRYSFNTYGNDLSYKFNMNFKVKVPTSTHVQASTVNEGDVKVSGVISEMEVHNINGSVLVSGATKVYEAMTINGNIDVKYANNAEPGGKYKTINGKITLEFPGELNADLSFKSMHGNIYSNYEDISYLKPQIVKNESKNGEKTQFKVEKYTPVRIGKGGKRIEIETLNGDAFVKKTE